MLLCNTSKNRLKWSHVDLKTGRISSHLNKQIILLFSLNLLLFGLCHFNDIHINLKSMTSISKSFGINALWVPICYCSTTLHCEHENALSRHQHLPRLWAEIHVQTLQPSINAVYGLHIKPLYCLHHASGCSCHWFVCLHIAMFSKHSFSS